ncbi:hypothetical protein HK101_000633, partial [Irineochytrium annulatum]
MVPPFLGRLAASAVAAVVLAASVYAESFSLIIKDPSSSTVVAPGDSVTVSWIYNVRGLQAIDPITTVNWTISNNKAFAAVV